MASSSVDDNETSAREKDSCGNSDEFGKCTVISKEIVAKGAWLSFSKLSYQDAAGAVREYECSERVTRPSGMDIDSVAMIATLRRALHYDCLLLVKQFRPPLAAFTAEFPSGLIDPGETAEQCALRELKEETGYTASQVRSISAAVCVDPGASSACERLVSVVIDGDDKVNARPEQQLDDGEYIQVILIPMNDLLNGLNELSKSGVYVDSKVLTYAMALHHHEPPPEPGYK